MKKITILALAALSSFAMAKSYQNIHVQHHGKIANIPSHAPIMTRQAAATRSAVRVRPLALNQRGVARITGNIRRLGMAAYRFHGQAGQQVRITPIGNNYSMEFGLFDHIRGMNFGRTHVLPTTGEYEVRIVQTRKNAARNRKSYRYDANVYLGSAAGNNPNPPVRVNRSVSQTPVAVTQNSHTRRHAPPSVTDSYSTAPNNTPDGARRVVPINSPINGERSGKISALPRQQSLGVRENVNRRHVNYSDEPVVSRLKRDQKSGRKANKKSASKSKALTNNYRCQSGGNLQVTQRGDKMTVKNKNVTVHLQKNNTQSGGRNQIYTGNNGSLHLVTAKQRTEVLSFDYKGKTLAFGCK